MNCNEIIRTHDDDDDDDDDDVDDDDDDDDDDEKNWKILPSPSHIFFTDPLTILSFR